MCLQIQPQDRLLIAAASPAQAACLAQNSWDLCFHQDTAQSKYKAAFIQTYAVFSEVILLY